MVYLKQNWEDVPSETTPISAERLEHLETQYDEALATINATATYISTSPTPGTVVLSGSGSLSIDPTNQNILVVHEADNVTTQLVPKLDNNRRIDVSLITPRIAPSASRPIGVLVGTMVFDTTLNKPIWYKGSGWVDATGASV